MVLLGIQTIKGEKKIPPYDPRKKQAAYSVRLKHERQKTKE